MHETDGRRHTKALVGLKMAKFDSRPLKWTDILGRFEAHSHQTHTHNTLGLIGALQDRGWIFWPEGSSQRQRWDEGCAELWSFLNRLGTRRDLEKQDLATAMREFIQEFEHTTGRMYQMLYGEVEDPDNDPNIAELFDWFNFTFRSAIYALLSGWIDDKQDHFLVTARINLTTGETSQERSGTPMRVPKKYRHTTRRL